MTPRAVNLARVFAGISDHWNPRIAGQVNGMYVKVVKFEGPFTWHHHDEEDELFLVVDGEFTMRFRDRDEQVRAGEFIIVPHGVEHQPVDERECSVVLFEPATTLNTGNVENDFTRATLERVET